MLDGAAGTTFEYRVTQEDPRSPAGRLLIGMLSQELAERYPEDGASGNSDYDIEAAAVQPGAAFLIAWVGDEPAGCGALRPIEGGVGEIKRMFVAPEFRGRGIAGGIVRALEEIALSRGWKTVRLESGVRQPEANRVYERAGFLRIPCWGKYAECALSVCFEKQMRD